MFYYSILSNYLTTPNREARFGLFYFLIVIFKNNIIFVKNKQEYMKTNVNFEIAKLLKDKEFMDKNMYGEVRLSHPKFYDSHGVIHNIKDAFEKTELNLKECYNAPSITEVVMWLYEKHDVWISVNNQLPRNEKRFEGYVSKVILPPYQHNKLSTFLHLTDLYTSPTEAYEAAITHTLENLI